MKNRNTFELYNLNEKKGKIKIKHKLYGNQEIEGIFSIIDDENKVGVKIGGSCIFLWRSEIINIEVSDYFASIQGDLMQIEIIIE